MKKLFLRICVAAALAATTTAPSLAHADEWSGVRHPLFFENGTTVTPAMIQDGQGPLLKHCMSVAWETIPGRARTILGKAFTQGGVGAVSQVAASNGEVAVLGETLVKNANPALALFGFLGNVFFGASSGDNEVNQLFRSATDACLARAGGGLYTMAPSEQDQILKTGVSHTVGVSVNWRYYNPNGAPISVTPGALVQASPTN